VRKEEMNVSSFFYAAKKYCYCKFFHNRYLCYPEVWGRGVKGPWHCSKCHPCGEWIDILLKELERKK